MEESEELLDLVNGRDEVVGTLKRGEIARIFAGKGEYVRYSEVFLRNSSGELWIPTRTSQKKIHPNGLDFSAAEHIGKGESYIDAAVRGLREELKLDVDPAKLRMVGKLSPAPAHPWFACVYLLEADNVPDYNREDFSGYQWLAPSEVLELIRNGTDAKDDLAAAIALIQARPNLV